MSSITISPAETPISVYPVVDPVVVAVSDTPIEFPQVVEAHNQLEEDALFLAGAKIVIRTDLI